MGWFGWLVVILILWFIIANPALAAQDARNLAHFLHWAFQGFAAFLTDVAG